MDKNKNEDIGKQKNHLGKEIITNLRWIGKRCGEFLLKISQDDYENPSPAPKVEPESQDIGDNPTSSDPLHGVGKNDDIKDINLPQTPLQDQDRNVSTEKLIKEIVQTIEIYDNQAAKVSDEAQKNIYNEAANILIEKLILAGCVPINPKENDKFDFAIHRTNIFSPFNNNRYIKRTVRIGVLQNDTIHIKAIVELKEENEYEVLQ